MPNKQITRGGQIMVIYAVASISKDGKHTHCIGWFKSYEEAEKEVLNDTGDFSEEGENEYAVIEKVDDGVFPISEVQKWFRADVKKDDEGYVVDIKYKPIAVPEKFKGIINFSIG